MNKYELFNDIKNDIGARLDELEGTHYVCDLSYTLTETENINGAWLIYAESRKFLFENYEFVSDVLDELDEELKPHCSPFEEPEKFLCIIMINAYALVWGAVENEINGTSVTINDGFRSQVKKELDEIKYHQIFF